MNLSILSADEVLRMCSPQSELEARLFSICNDLQSEVIDLKDQLKPKIDDDYCEECSDKVYAIREAIELINSGKVQDGVDALEDMV